MTGRPRSAVRAISATTGGAPGVRACAAGTGASARQAVRVDVSSANRATRDVVFNTVMSGTALSDVGHGLQAVPRRKKKGLAEARPPNATRTCRALEREADTEARAAR